MQLDNVIIKPIGYVRVIDHETSRIELDDTHLVGLSGLSPGDRLDVLYWMHELGEDKHRAMLVHPRGDKTRPQRGVFALRSPMRPNPIGVSLVTLEAVEGSRLLVRGLDAHDGSPV
ncbi:MAG: TrmO family methyltransferase, partial [Phycisphaerae bacterium]